jgi:hypothetical protein
MLRRDQYFHGDGGGVTSPGGAPDMLADFRLLKMCIARRATPK